jgi:hypothetical protein
MFYLSGAINVLLFLIIRPKLFLPFPKKLDGQEIQLTLTPQGTGPAIFSDTVKFQYSPEPTSALLEDGGSRNSVTPSHVKSRRISDDI